MEWSNSQFRTDTFSKIAREEEMAAAKREESISALIVDVAKSETSALPDGGDMLELFAAAEEEEEDLEELKKSCWKRLREAVPQIPWAREKRHRLGKWVESVPVQLALVLLLVFDVLVVGAELALEEFAAHEMVCVIANSSGSAASSSSFAAEATAVAVLVPPEHWVVALEEAMHYIGLTVLLVFMLELLLLIIAYDSHFFTHVMFVLDLLVVLL